MAECHSEKDIAEALEFIEDYWPNYAACLTGEQKHELAQWILEEEPYPFARWRLAKAWRECVSLLIADIRANPYRFAALVLVLAAFVLLAEYLGWLECGPTPSGWMCWFGARR